MMSSGMWYNGHPTGSDLPTLKGLSEDSEGDPGDQVGDSLHSYQGNDAIYNT